MGWYISGVCNGGNGSYQGYRPPTPSIPASYGKIRLCNDPTSEHLNADIASCVPMAGDSVWYDPNSPSKGSGSCSSPFTFTIVEQWVCD
jgi:hypothetical protein